MKRVLIFRFVLLGAAAVCGGALPGAMPASAQQRLAAMFPPTRFDGVYSVDVTTKDGTCGASHWTVRVADGQIASVSPNTTAISGLGLIESDGTVSLTFRDGRDQVAHVGGTVKGRGGKGFWSSPTSLCGGFWSAEKEK